MRPFRYRRGHHVDDVLVSLNEGHRPLAGGTDMLPLLKADIQQVPGLVDIKEAGLPRGIEETAEGGLRIGALTTLAELAASERLAERHALLGQAARSAATVQIRNRATVAGNLLQRPRCWYFRNPRTACWLKGGQDCPAVEGRNEHHAIFNASPCKAAHPSDLAGCLLALDATVSLLGPDGERRLSLSEFYAPPEESRRQETVIAANELLTSVDIPAAQDGWHSIYLKAMDRKVWAFALSGMAVALRRSTGTIGELRIVANGLSPIPRRLGMCEACLLGSAGGEDDIDAAVRALEQDTETLSENSYKLDLSQRLLRKALRELLEPAASDD